MQMETNAIAWKTKDKIRLLYEKIPNLKIYIENHKRNPIIKNLWLRIPSNIIDKIIRMQTIIKTEKAEL